MLTNFLKDTIKKKMTYFVTLIYAALNKSPKNSQPFNIQNNDDNFNILLKGS